MNETLRRVLQALVDLEHETGLPATVREISEKAGYASASGVDRHLATLESLGYITRERRVSRSIKATRSGKSQLRR